MQATAQSGGVAYKWIVALVVIFGAFMSILDQTIVNIAIPRLQSAFGADLNGVQWVLTAYILTQGVVTPTTAFFTNRVGIKRFYVLSLSLFTLGSALCGLAWSLPILITFRIIQGIGGAFLFPVAITLLYQEFPPNQRGLASGIFGIAALCALRCQYRWLEFGKGSGLLDWWTDCTGHFCVRRDLHEPPREATSG